MAKFIIKGGRVISPAQKLDDICDVLIEKGKIIARSPQFTADALSANVLTFQGTTPYVITGNWTIVISCLMIVILNLYRLQKKQAST